MYLFLIFPGNKIRAHLIPTPQNTYFLIFRCNNINNKHLLALLYNPSIFVFDSILNSVIFLSILVIHYFIMENMQCEITTHISQNT